MSGVSHRRGTWTKRTAQLAACGLLAASASLAVASTAIAAAGNNGAVFINNVSFDSNGNDPHVTCPIILDWTGFDTAGADFTVKFTPQAPTGGTVSTGGALAGHFINGSH